nr:MAG TPA: hypothetical protein [Caudoviricetes sp.]
MSYEWRKQFRPSNLGITKIINNSVVVIMIILAY